MREAGYWRTQPGGRMRIGMLTGGGDCPGLNAVIRAVVRKGEARHGDTFIGLPARLARRHRRGSRSSSPCGRRAGSWTAAARSSARSRTNPFQDGGDGSGTVHATLARERVEALIAIGGEDTLGVADKLGTEGRRTWSACRRRSTTISRRPTSPSGSTPRCRCACDAIDRLHTTAESHDRVMIVRGDGAPRGMDRDLCRDRRRRRT